MHAAALVLRNVVERSAQCERRLVVVIEFVGVPVSERVRLLVADGHAQGGGHALHEFGGIAHGVGDNRHGQLRVLVFIGKLVGGLHHGGEHGVGGSIR